MFNFTVREKEAITLRKTFDRLHCTLQVFAEYDERKAEANAEDSVKFSTRF